jgi:hypothetical protein
MFIFMTPRITILSNTVTISLVYAAGVSAIYHGTMSIPNVALTSIMACRVYRNATLHPRPKAGAVELSATSHPRSVGTPRINVPLNGHASSLEETWKAPVQSPGNGATQGFAKSEIV